MNKVNALPRVVVELVGSPLSTTTLRALAAVRVQQRLSQPTLCELTFRDPPGSLDALSDLMPGIAIRVLLGDNSVPLFVGEVTAVEHVYEATRGREMRVRGYDMLHRLRKRQSVRAHVQTTLRDLARDLANDLELSVAGDGADAVWLRLIQHRQSDFELLVDLAARSGTYLSLRENVLHLLTLDGIGEPIGLTYGDSLFETRVELNGDPSTRSVRATGWDPFRVETHEGETTHARIGREVSAHVLPQDVGGDGARALVNETTPSDRHADELAQAELDTRLAREVVLWGVAEGNPQLRPGARVNVTHISDALSGTYVLTAATHTIDDQRGYVTELTSEPPALRSRSTAAAATFGVVSRVDDPDHLGRIKVTLPTYANVETEWMNVVSAAAGGDKGLMALPDVNDRVLLLLLGEDPAQGIVIGGLYGPQSWPDDGVDGQAVKRYTFQTRGGQRIRLDDARTVVRIEDKTGSYVELSPDKVRLHAAVDMDLEAPGKRVTIRGQQIDFERG